MEKTSLGDLKTTTPFIISPECMVSSALQLLKSQNFNSLLVVDENSPEGLFTEHDALIFTLNNRNGDITSIREAMSSLPPITRIDTSLSKAAEILEENDSSELLVLNSSGSIQGLVKRKDILLSSLQNKSVASDKSIEQNTDAHQRFLESIERISKILSEQQHAPNLLKSLTNEILDIFKVDRAWLIHPCDPNAEYHTIAVESNLPDYPGASESGRKLQTSPSLQKGMSDALASGKPHIHHTDEMEHPPEILDTYNIKSQMMTALHPPAHSPWLMGLHQCSYKRKWSVSEQNLFQTISERVGLVLSSRLLMQEIRKRETQLREAENFARLGRWELNVETGQANWSQQIHNIFGTTKDQIVGPEFLSTRVNPEDWPSLERSLQDSIVNGSAHEMEYRISNSKGDERWLFCKAERVLDADGNPLKLSGVAQDITDRKKTEQQLALAGEEWTQAMDQLDNAVYMLDLDRCLTRANKAFYSMIGTDAKASLGRNIASLVHPDCDSTDCPLCEAQENHQESIITMEADSPFNPTQKPIEVDLKLVRDKSGSKTGMLITLHDLTNIRKTQERLRLAANVFDNTDEGIVITDTSGAILDLNRAFEEILGYSRKELLGSNPRVWKSGRHDREFYRDMWTSLKESGVWRGEIWNRRKDGGIWPSWQTVSSVTDELGNLTHYVSVISDISQIKQSQDKLDHLAHHDALTDLPNRLLLNERLDQAIRHAKRQNTQFAIIFLDLDHFKHINDSMGHPVGDELLQKVAQILVDSVRQDDTVARIGGDEFVLLLHDIEHAENAGVVAQKLVTAVSQPIPLKHREMTITSSMGVCLYPQDGLEVTTLLRNADSAIYRAKEEGRNTYQYYTKELTHNAFERVLLENSLRQAISKDELRLHYQPQIDMTTDKVIGVEALVRWQHEQFGMIAPDKFIPLAEESGIIHSIGHWVLKKACLQAREWINRSVPFGRISVNIAGIQLQRSGLVDKVKKVLKETGLPSKYLELEITESSIMKPAGVAFEQLTELRLMGVALAIDDFGTGYSSLNYLKQLPIHKLKIDRSFIKDIPDDCNDMAIADAIIAVGKSLGLSVIAEGVETQSQVDFLKSAGCHEGQGFLFSRPVPAKKVEKFIMNPRSYTETTNPPSQMQSAEIA